MATSACYFREKWNGTGFITTSDQSLSNKARDGISWATIVYLFNILTVVGRQLAA